MAEARGSRPEPASEEGRGFRIATPAHRRSGNRVFLLGIAVSILLHLVASYTISFRFEPPAGRPDAAYVPAPAASGMQVVDVVAVATDAAEPLREPDPQRTTQPTAPSFFPMPGAPAAGAGQEARPGETQRSIEAVGDRLRPRLGHTEVWTPQRERLPDPTADEVVRRRVAGQLATWNDSVAAETEAARRARDWTISDGRGGRIGVDDGRIHLGSITLPGRIEFPTPPGRREEAQKRMIQWEEIRRQSEQQYIREVLDDRARAIRARVDAQRDSTATRPITSTGGSGR
jgi:hypothetical protein